MYHNHNTKHNHIDANDNQFILAVTKCKFKPFYYYKTRNLDSCILKNNFLHDKLFIPDGFKDLFVFCQENNS